MPVHEETQEDREEEERAQAEVYRRLLHVALRKHGLWQDDMHILLEGYGDELGLLITLDGFPLFKRTFDEAEAFSKSFENLTPEVQSLIDEIFS